MPKKKEQKTYNDELKDATRDYFKEAVNDDKFDPVINQNIDMAKGVIENNDYDGFSGSVITDFDTFDAANNKVKDEVSKNATKLAENRRLGERARANAGK